MAFKTLFRPVLIAFGAVITATFFVFGGLVVILIFPYRCIVWALAKLTRPDLSAFITDLSSIFMLDSCEKPTLNLVSLKIIMGTIELEQMRNLMKERLIDKLDDKGRHVYARLWHSAANFMGYSFWKQDNNFSIENHVRMYDFTEPQMQVPRPCREEDLRRIMSGLLAAPWKTGRSPWEFLLLQHYQPEGDLTPGAEKMVLVCRFHHGIGDGHSSAKLLSDMGLEYKPVAMPATYEKPLWSRIILPIIYPFKLCYDLADNIIGSIDTENAWHPRGVKLSKTYYTSFTRPIPVSFVKEIKRKHGVSYITVLYAATAGAIRRIMIEAGQKVPKTMSCFNPVPKPNHPGGMVNHMRWVFTTLPIKVENPLERLMKIQMNLNQLKTSLTPASADAITLLFGMMPLKLRRAACCLIRGTLMASNFPVPPDAPIFEGHLVPDVIFGCGTWEVKCGANIFMIGLAGKQRVVVNVDRNVFPSEHIFKKLGSYIEEELDILLDQTDKSPEFPNNIV